MKSLLRILLALAATAVAAFAQTGTAIPGGNQSATYVITKPGRYYLAADRIQTNGNANVIEINVPDVTLDLNGYALKSTSPTGSGCGVFIQEPINVEIRNGSLSHLPGRAINAESSLGSDLRLIDLRISSSKGFGSICPNVLVDRCHFSDIEGNAIWATGTNTVIRHCQLTNVTNGSGIVIGGRGTVINNTISSIAHYGIRIFLQSAMEEGTLVANNVVSLANTAKIASVAGITADSTSGNVIRNNVVTRTFGTGITADSGSIVEGNTVSHTKPSAGSGVGVGISSSNGSTILRNNTGLFNAGGLISGPYSNAGGNFGS